MADIEQDLWNATLKGKLVAGPGQALAKVAQQALAGVLQEWAAKCISAHLEAILKDKQRDDLAKRIRRAEWQVNHRGKDFLGAVRWQEVDVWLTNDVAGLVLAVDPKHFQSQDSLKKNWKNGLNDLVAFATNLHERFPACAVGGVISFPQWAAAKSDLQQMHSICARSIPRERPLNAYGKFEGFALAPYDARGDLVWPFETASPLSPASAFDALASAVYARTISLL